MRRAAKLISDILLSEFNLVKDKINREDGHRQLYLKVSAIVDTPISKIIESVMNFEEG